MQHLIALRPLTYGTRRLRAGECFSALDSHARLLVAIGRARAAQPEPAPACDLSSPFEYPRAEPEPQPKRRRTYKRRDLRAED